MYRRVLILFTTVLLVTQLSISLACSSVDSTDGDQAMVNDQAADSMSAAATGTGTGAASGDAKDQGVLLFGIGMHIEPLGATPSTLAGGGWAGASGNAAGNATGNAANNAANNASGNAANNAAGNTATKGDYNNPAFYQRQVADIQSVAAIVASHDGRLTVQAQTPFTTVTANSGNTVLADLAAHGHEIALHFHEDAHLGKNPEKLPVATWCAVMQEEIGILKQAAGQNTDIRYWSGGNLYPGLIDAASCAGLDVNSDWKNPKEQKTVSDLIGVNPWRPAGGSNVNDVTQFAAHDPEGPVVFLPEGAYGRSDFAGSRRDMDGDQAYFDFLKDSLMDSLAAAAADPSRVSVFHFTVHAGEFRGDAQHPFEVIDRFLNEVVDPLVAAGKVQWATFSEMADTYTAWEQDNPGVSPRAK